MANIDPTRPGKIRKWYNVFWPLYDPLLGLLEGSGFNQWRHLLWSKIEGKRILEVGVGTGRNFPFYPAGGSITAVDFSDKMLARASQKAGQAGLRVQLELMDVQHLAFQANAFDTVVSSWVFCEIADPVQGLKEVKRVVRSGGKVLLLEHGISDNKWLARLMNLTNPLLSGLVGENINRDTAYNVKESGLIVEKVTRLAPGICLIEARKERIYMLK
ncbi:MAG: class I SAM-dependent methyltransferase [Dehalococcoidales bacterium]|nr:class I SAM-dependent methyltransferase [Dehalococcoidales bacterium]